MINKLTFLHWKVLFAAIYIPCISNHATRVKLDSILNQGIVTNKKDRKLYIILKKMLVRVYMCLRGAFQGRMTITCDHLVKSLKMSTKILYLYMYNLNNLA